VSDLTQTLTKPEASQFKKSKSIIRRWCNDRFKVGAELMRIRDERLYRADFGSFDAFVQKEYNWTRENAYKLISANEIKQSLPSNVTQCVTNPRQANALIDVPERDRPAVLEAAATTGSVTAKSITEAAKPKPTEAKAEPVILRDKVGDGRVIPDEILADWQRAQEVSETLRRLCTQIKTVLTAALESKDPVFVELATDSWAQMPAIAELDGMRFTLSHILPHALCPICQGKGRKSCQLCRKRGWISKRLYSSPVVSKQIKAILERPSK
jgi:hypothetical protein